MNLSNNINTKELRQQLRREDTPSEHILWKRLCGKQVCGLKFRRQHGYGAYVLDFYCPAIRLCIEVDGDVHDSDEAKQHDAKRTTFLNQMGIKVIRFRNKDIENNIDNVIDDITNYIKNGDWVLRYAKTPNPLT